MRALCACVRVGEQCKLNKTLILPCLSKTPLTQHSWFFFLSFTCSRGGTLSRAQRTTRLLTKDLPVLGVLCDEVQHVLGLHHLRKAEGGRHGSNLSRRSRTTLIRSSASGVLHEQTISITRNESTRTQTDTQKMWHNTIRAALSEGSPRSLASGKLRAKQKK